MTQSNRGCLFEIVETVVLTVLIFFGIQTFVAQPYKVQQTSMERTLLEDQYVLVDKLSPRWDAYGRGDIVVFTPPEACSGGDVPFIKRVIGLPGDSVELRDGDVLINGTALEEPYIYSDGGVPQETLPSGGGRTSWLVAAGELFVMGDHRMASADSRSCGPIPTDHVIGRAWLRYWPFDQVMLIDQPTYPELATASP